MSEETEEVKEPLYTYGDKLRVVNYGHMWYIEWEELSESMIESILNGEISAIGQDDKSVWADMRPEIVGHEGEVISKTLIMGVPAYILEGLDAKWLSESQLEKI